VHHSEDFNLVFGFMEDDAVGKASHQTLPNAWLGLSVHGRSHANLLERGPNRFDKTAT
jgi:hypothetical protein